VFELKALDIGKVLSITVGHGSVGRGRGWYCAGVRLRTGDSKDQLLFPCDRLVSIMSILYKAYSSSYDKKGLNCTLLGTSVQTACWYYYTLCPPRNVHLFIFQTTLSKINRF